MTERRLRVEDFAYDLPTATIAQEPAEPRDSSRLLVLDRRSGRVEHARFRDIGRSLRAGDLLVTNDSRVIRARLRGTRPGGGAAEILVLRPLDGSADSWAALVRPSRRIRAGSEVTLRSGDVVHVGETLEGGTRAVRFARNAYSVLEASGEMPLPPYITAQASGDERYQTVYARAPGSAAAPTAGLHFTVELLRRLAAAGVGHTAVTLHVGLDTFRPLEGEFIDEHHIHREWYEVPPEAADAIERTRRQGGRVVAVGTTSVRVLETAAGTGARSGWTDLYITPPHPFRSVDALVTNFHLPRSSLLLLVTAFVQADMPAGATAYDARDVVLGAYRAALEDGYRFFSFGDAMLIL